MALTATEHSIEEIRPGDLQDWLAGGGDVGADALVLELGSSTAALDLVGDLRAEGHWVPVLLVASSEPGWTSEELLAMPGVDVLPLPLDPQRLQSALTQVLQHPRTPPSAKPDQEPTALLEDVPDLDASPDPDWLATTPELVPEPVPVPEPEPEPVPVPEPRTKATARRKRKQPATPSPIRLDPSIPPVPQDEVAVLPPKSLSTVASAETRNPVEGLLAEADDLYTLEEIATVIVDDAVVLSMADAGAFLVPDGELWRVSAGVGIRPLEYRLQLTSESWLVENTATAGKGILIEESDVARRDLRGAPLASRTHLMVVPVPDVHAILVLARDRAEPFTEQSLGALAKLAGESGPLLAQAIELRSLARALARHLDVE